MRTRKIGRCPTLFAVGLIFLVAWGLVGLPGCNGGPVGPEHFIQVGPTPVLLEQPGDTVTMTVSFGKAPFTWSTSCECVSLTVATDSWSALVTGVKQGKGEISVFSATVGAVIPVEVINP